MKLTDIVQELASELKINRHIHAMWLEGSYATGENNELSDIDVWMDVDDGLFDHAFNIFEKHLDKIVGCEWGENRGIYSENPKLAKRIYYLKGFSEDNAIELDLQEHSRNFVFPKGHPIKVLFDKDNTIEFKK